MTESSAPSTRPGTLRALLGRFISLALVRAELFSIEAREQKEMLLGQLALGFLAFFALLVALMAGLLFVVVITPVGARPLVLGGIALGALLICLALLWRLVMRLRNQPPAFDVTLTEIRKDCQTLFNLRD
ncbi:MAG: phage holin family protein [Paludibacterium sp.]|uniref:phage holin family protein n=1 Tax=Paludibacterium sp. TaxID=1917523 RepID=UPI0025DCF620|nr:phage holin family protein [Paludibacterium sp.]MBV8046538.1 phage holin family protein [Paludibacterium sp.]MBV8646767.1 phage holin family protein [Paludibacterium sp.]